MKKRLWYNIAILFLILLLVPTAMAAFYTNLNDDWDWDSGTNYDNKIWDDYIEGDYGTIIEIRGEDWDGDDADAVCLDFDVQDSNGFDYCFYDDTIKECDAVSTVFTNACNKGCQSGYSGADIHITYALDNDGNDRVYARMYFDCDQSSGPYTTQDDYEWYYDFDARRTYCYGSASNTFYLEAKDEYDEQWDIFSTLYCSSLHNSYWGCALWDEETVYTAEDSFDEDPCKIKDGSLPGYACSSDTDCVSQDCSGSRLEYFSECKYPDAIWYNLTTDNYDNSCGGSGYFVSSDEDEHTCSTGKLCDPDLTGEGISSASVFCKNEPGTSCSQNSDCWDDYGDYDCIGGYCNWCGDGFCDVGETYSNCEEDCCLNDCTGSEGGEMGWSDDICHETCNGENSCEFSASVCDGEYTDSYECIDANSRVLCCEGTPTDCSGNQYCSSGYCYNCNTQCNDNCQSSGCYGTDPDCDSNGNLNGNCGDGVCCQETYATCPADCPVQTDLAIVEVIPIQVIPNVDMVKGKSGFVRVIVHNNGPVDATGQVNVIFDGAPLVPVNNNATKLVANQTNVSFDFVFKPNVTGSKVINANVTVVG
jgi:hypothetical protein